MDMSINQPGKKSAVAQVDDFGASRVFDRCPHLGDAVALDEDFSWLENAAGLHVEQTRRVQDDRVGGRGRGLACCIHNKRQQRR